MTNDIHRPSHDSLTPHAEAARSGEHLQAANEPDPFPPEGTDEKVVRPASEVDTPLSDAEATRATMEVIAQGLSGRGKTEADWSDGGPPQPVEDGN